MPPLPDTKGIGSVATYRLRSPARTRRSLGFTLIELMIVVVIISILSTLAIPTYKKYIVRATRSDAQALMLDLATREHQYFMTNRAYADTTTLGFSMPNDLASDYAADFTITDGPPPSFTITFTPVTGGPQEADVTLTIDSAGNKTPEEKWSK